MIFKKLEEVITGIGCNNWAGVIITASYQDYPEVVDYVLQNHEIENKLVLRGVVMNFIDHNNDQMIDLMLLRGDIGLWDVVEICSQKRKLEMLQHYVVRLTE